MGSSYSSIGIGAEDMCVMGVLIWLLFVQTRHLPTLHNATNAWCQSDYRLGQPRCFRCNTWYAADRPCPDQAVCEFGV